MDSTTPPPAQQPPQATEDKTVAILSYITLIGFIVAIVIHSSKKTKLGAFHLRQTLGLFITYLCACFLLVIPIIGWIAFPLLTIALFVLWIMGLIAAINAQMKPMPVVGEYYQKWFGNTFD